MITRSVLMPHLSLGISWFRQQIGMRTACYWGFNPVPSNTGLYRAAMFEISTVTARYKSVTINFERRRPLPGGISLAAAREEARERGRRRGRTSDDIAL
ncbi:hypothetical protein B296_00052907 [Ensete ventricosum]|uniref:Uncharacterized protein n=1 Tax=Ensete ventricosum TaxID=4639 RepID=A0A426XBS7_ENSVE|nr:hypothetical protein B296_00052907 [Ensete ventricosum]